MSGVNERMAMVVYDNLAVSIEDNSAKFIAQDVINAAWARFDMSDESTWPEKDGLYLTFCVMKMDGKPFRTIDRNWFAGRKWNHSENIVVCYAAQELLEPVL